MMMIIDKIYLYVKHPNTARYQYVIKECENDGLESLKNRKALIECLKNVLMY